MIPQRTLAGGVALLAGGLVVGGIVLAQPERGPRLEGPRRNGPGRDGLFQMLDADHDGTLSAQEIEQAAKVLKALDRNGDGSVSAEELPRPERPGRGGRDGDRPNGRPPAEETPSGAAIRDGKISVRMTGGHDIGPNDYGRPVSLIAAGLGVKPDVFRQAFSGVTPARGGGPTEGQARSNKAALLSVLGKHGVTNERLDEVSNYYRFNPGAGETWKQSPAEIQATITEGKVTGFKIVNAGAGYSSPPTVTIPGYPNVQTRVTLEYGTNLTTNGRISSVEILLSKD